MRLYGLIAFVVAGWLTVVGVKTLLASSSGGSNDEPPTSEPAPSPSPPPVYSSRWPTEWPPEKPSWLGPEVPWPPPVPDPRIPVPPECKRLEAMDGYLADVVRSPDPVGMASYLNAINGRDQRTIRLRDDTVQVSIDLQADAGDLVERYDIRVPRWVAAHEYRPKGGLSGFVPLNRLCALANDPRVRRVSLPSYPVAF